MAAVNDRELLVLYNTKRAELFPTLRREGALKPLVVLIAVLTPLFAQVNDGIDSADARWGLASLEFVSTSEVDTAAGESDAVVAAGANQKPLAALLTALSLQIPWISLPVGLSLVSVISAIGGVLVWHSLCRTMLGSRFAFWSAVIVACHGPFLVQSKTASAAMLTLFLMLCAVWGLFSHLRRVDGIASGYLLFGGITLGLCLLTDGLAVIAVVTLGIILAIVLRFGSNRQGQGSGSSPSVRSHWQGNLLALKSVGAMALTAFAVGGWWLMRAASAEGAEFWPMWLGWRESSESAVATVGARGAQESVLAACNRLVDRLDVLFVPAIYGLWCVVRELWRYPDRTRRLPLQFLCVWVLVATIVWMVQPQRPWGESTFSGLFLMFPLVACAMIVVEQIATRRCGLATATGLACLSLIFPLAAKAVRPAILGGYQVNVWEPILPILAYLSLIALLGVWMLFDVRHHERRERICLVGMLSLLAFASITHGLGSVRMTGEEQRSRDALTAFQKGLNAPEIVDAQVLIADSAAPPDVEFVIRATRPALSFETANDWNTGVARATAWIRDSKRSVLIVDWRTLGSRTARPLEQKLEVNSLLTPIVLHGRRLSAYVLSRRIQPM